MGDEELQEKQLSTDLQAGVRMFDEWRKIRGLPLVGGEKGKSWVQVGKGAQESGAEGAAGPGEKPQQPGSNPDEQAKPKSPLEKTRPRNGAWAGSLPPRIMAMLNGRNGKH